MPATLPAAFAPLLERAQRLYCLPTVAMETLELSRQPSVDGRALRESLERDPALVGKLLRVANSPVFGVAGGVSDLGQAISLLGDRSLRLLVLGFSIPEALHEGLPAERLSKYWTHTLARAVAARELARFVSGCDGDEAFTAALLADLGLLAMLQQLGAPFATLLDQADQNALDPMSLERRALGFDRGTLTGAMLRGWGIPDRLPDAIAEAWRIAGAFPQQKTESPLAAVVHLAEMAARVLADHRLTALPELTEASADTAGLDADALHALLAEIEPKLVGLCDALRLPKPGELGFAKTLAEGYARLAELTEQAAAGLAPPERGELAQMETMLATTFELVSLVADEKQYSDRKPRPDTRRAEGPETMSPHLARGDAALETHTRQAAAECRQRRCSLSLLLGAVDPGDDPLRLGAVIERVRQVLGEELATDSDRPRVAPTGELGVSVIAKGIDRQEAVRAAKKLIHAEDRSAGVLNFGVATVAVPPAGFDAAELLAAAQRCLAAARNVSGPAVKSIEVY
ncbi:HDOD domain protein [Pirellulimonas nuda]|uniref:HDOD domain protein n=1 Tax=Pirellulimonas nuda TaxID=2528009 RepID=A0A518D732_9BACT|nr:HDOD domain-containing protein [Pirellulimonas nuda]QDU87265.1 HDOD domain protein [Pirellulimonas nuda]